MITESTTDENGTKTMMRFGRLEELDRSFDLEFWQSQDPTARFKAVEELVNYYLKRQGRENERRLQRSVGSLQRISGVPFDQAWNNRHEVQIDEQTVRFIGLQDLITAKEASGRPQDLLDAARLYEALERLRVADRNHSEGAD